MSTKRTLYFDDVFHLYADGFDSDNVYLEVQLAGGPIGELVVKIPLIAWKEMRQHTIQPEERYLDLSDAELIVEAERAVDEHREWLAAAPNSPLKSMAGLFLFGPPELSRAEMIERFIGNYRPALAEARQAAQ
jgi:hypothetical protein